MTIYRRKKTFYSFTLASFLVFMLFIVISVISIIGEEYINILVGFVFLLLVGGLFLFIALSEFRSSLEIGTDKIVFHYMVFSKDKGLRGLNRKGMPVYWKDVKAIRITHIRGDQILSANSVFVTFFLHDGRLFETTFFHFGKDQEQEILSKIGAYAHCLQY